MMRILLVFPPHWVPVMPHLALPTLTAALRAQGHQVVQRDLNIETFDTILGQAYLEQTLAWLSQSRAVAPSHTALVARGPRIAREVPSAKMVMRDARFYDGRTSRRAFLTLVEALALASLPFAPSKLQFTSFVPPVPVDQSADLLSVVGDPTCNIFLDLFHDGILQDILADPPDIVGISIPTLDQMLAGMTLAHLIKANDLPCHVTVGGPHISMLRDQLPQSPQMFDLIDSAIVFNGETALQRLAEAISTGSSLDGVPNLIYRERDGSRGGANGSGSVRVNPTETAPPADLLPDFDGLPLDRYLTPSPVLPLLSSHGCYHGKCAFCNVGYGGPQTFRQIDPERVVAHMLALRDAYGARHFFFADEALTPRVLRVMSEELAQSAPDIHWCGCVRFDNGLSQDLLQKMAAGGGRMLLFGLETAAESTIERMHKGTTRPVISRILRDSAAAGIWNHAFFFFGFPGETMAAAQETVNFVYAHQDAIHSASPGAFLLERYAPAHQFPEQYGITKIVQDPQRDLAIYFDYEVAQGLDEATADELATRLVDVLPEKPFGQYYITDTYRLLYASRLWEQGQPLPLWLA
jgi:anaerobic magnesium-protoporphyrin IX monomethyl ester cyclase